MESRHNIEVSRQVFNKFRPLMTDPEGNPLTEDVMTNGIDAVGHIDINGLDGKISIMVGYCKPDSK